MKKKLQRQTGITLIALIITIIIMLILVAVSISVALNTGLFKSAGDATKNWKTAQEKESKAGSEIIIDGKIYESVEKYLAGESVLPEIKAGERAKETSKYQTAVIPKGFTVSNIPGENDVAAGLVIYDIPKDTEVNWEDEDSVRTAYNQFVWIPVEVTEEDSETNVASFSRCVWQDNARIANNVQSSNSFPSSSNAWSKYTEPYSFDKTNNYDAEGKTGISKQIEELTKSIYNYQGFWFGRYEAGSKTERSRSSGVTEIGIKQNLYPYNYVKWGDSMSSIGTTGAVTLSNSLYNSENYGATSMLCTGAAWDKMLDFIKDTEVNVTNSIYWGNYKNSNFTVNKGKYAELSGNALETFNPLSETFEKKEYSSTNQKTFLFSTGASEQNKAKNIYDVAGNCFEWTTESYSSDNRIGRGRRLQSLQQ